MNKHPQQIININYNRHMNWERPDNRNWICNVLRDARPPTRTSFTTSVTTVEGELCVTCEDDDNERHIIVFAAGAWVSLEIYVRPSTTVE